MVLFAVAGVGDDVEEVFGSFLQAGDHAVVDHATGLWVQKGGKCGLAGLEVFESRGRDRLEESLGAGAVDVVLYHMADVEERAFLARPIVAIRDGEVAVLHGHGVAAERNHFAAVFKMHVVQRGPARFLFRVEDWCWRGIGALGSPLLASGR